MLYIVHPELVEQSSIPAPEGIENPNLTTQYFCTSQAVWYDKNNDNAEKYKEIPLFRLISDIDEFNTRPLSIITTGDENSKKTKTTIRALPRNKENANIVVLAIPFNGKMIPLEDSDKYRLHKGILVTSDSYSINLVTNEEQKYKKVLYLVIELLDTNFDIKFISHSKRKNPKDPDGDPLWNENTITVSITDDVITTTYDHTVLQTWVDSNKKKKIFTPAAPTIKTVKPQPTSNVRTFTRENAKTIHTMSGN